MEIEEPRNVSEYTQGSALARCMLTYIKQSTQINTITLCKCILYLSTYSYNTQVSLSQVWCYKLNKQNKMDITTYK